MKDRKQLQSTVNNALDTIVFAGGRQDLMYQSPMGTALDLAEHNEKLAKVNIVDLVHYVHDYQTWYKQQDQKSASDCTREV